MIKGGGPATFYADTNIFQPPLKKKYFSSITAYYLHHPVDCCQVQGLVELVSPDPFPFSLWHGHLLGLRERESSSFRSESFAFLSPLIHTSCKIRKEGGDI
jgi:hypothetical protein